MRKSIGRLQPSPAMVIACASLVVALSGIAWAAATIGPKDIKRNAVRTKHIKNRVVTPTKLAGAEPLRIVGAPGQPQFFNGGDGDCIWNPSATSSHRSRQSASTRIPTVVCT